MADNWDVDGWKWSWQRPLAGRTLSSFKEMLRFLGEFRCSETADQWMWKIGSDGNFTAGETRRWIDDTVLPLGSVQSRWCVFVPHKVNIFIWRLRLQRIPIRVALSGRGLEIPLILCPICGVASEYIAHLFGRCEVAAVFGGSVSMASSSSASRVGFGGTI